MTRVGSKWTPAEDEILRANAELGYAALMDQLPDRSRSGIEARCAILRLNVKHPRTKGAWSEADDEFLANNLHRGLYGIGRLIGRSTLSVDRRIGTLGLRAKFSAARAAKTAGAVKAPPPPKISAIAMELGIRSYPCPRDPSVSLPFVSILENSHASS